MQLYCVKGSTNVVTSHISQVDIKYLYDDMVVPVMLVDQVVSCASLVLTVIQAGDSAMSLVPGYRHNTTQ